MLVELSALGLPADGELVVDLLNPVALVSPNPPPIEAPSVKEQGRIVSQKEDLCALDPVVVTEAFCNEPAGLIARLLHLHPWPWREAVVEQLAPVKRRFVQSYLQKLREQPGTQPPEALRFNLVRAFHKRMTQVRAVTGALPVPAVRIGGPDARPWNVRLSRWKIFVRRGSR
jgi:hypothetical protein